MAAKAESAAGQVAVKAGVAAEQVAVKAGAAAEQVAASGPEITPWPAGNRKAHVAGEYVREGADSAARDGPSERLQAGPTPSTAATPGCAATCPRAAEATSDYIAANSGKAVLFAAGAGFLIGFLATRGRRELAPAGI